MLTLFLCCALIQGQPIRPGQVINSDSDKGSDEAGDSDDSDQPPLRPPFATAAAAAAAAGATGVAAKGAKKGIYIYFLLFAPFCSLRHCGIQTKVNVSGFLLFSLDVVVFHL